MSVTTTPLPLHAILSHYLYNSHVHFVWALYLQLLLLLQELMSLLLLQHHLLLYLYLYLYPYFRVCRLFVYLYSCSSRTIRYRKLLFFLFSSFTILSYIIHQSTKASSQHCHLTSSTDPPLLPPAPELPIYVKAIQFALPPFVLHYCSSFCIQTGKRCFVCNRRPTSWICCLNSRSAFTTVRVIGPILIDYRLYKNHFTIR